MDFPPQTGWSEILSHGVTLVVGAGGSIAAYIGLKQRQTEGVDARIQRFEERTDRRIAYLEAEDEKKDAEILRLTKELGGATTQLDKMGERVQTLEAEREQNLYLIGQLQVQNKALLDQNELYRGQIRALGGEVSDAVFDDSFTPPPGLNKTGDKK